MDKDNLYNFVGVPEVDIDKELNSWFHFKLEKYIPKDLIYPGIISEFKENVWKRMYSVQANRVVSVSQYLKMFSKLILPILKSSIKRCLQKLSFSTAVIPAG